MLKVDEKMYNDEAKGIVELMLRLHETWRIGQHFDWRVEEYPQEFEDNRIKYMIVVWSKENMIVTMQEMG